MENDIWYNKEGAVTHNAMLTYCVGGRGVGKTFGYKQWCLEKEGQFMWVRRYSTELKKAKRTFLNDLRSEGKLPEGNWEVKGDNVLKDGEVKGWFISLSKGMLEKSSSYKEVDVIVFDEALLGPGVHHYLNNEVEIMLELIETVNRTRGFEGKREVRVFCLANKTTMVNPHFAYWGITDMSKRYTWAPGKKGLVLVENYDNESFKEKKRETKMGKLIAGTDYGNYSIENEVWFDDDSFIDTPPAGFRRKCMENIAIGGKLYGLWTCDNGYWYMMHKTDVSRPTLTCSEGDHKEGTFYMGSMGVASYMKSRYELGGLFFEDVQIKSAAIEIMQRFGSLRRVRL